MEDIEIEKAVLAAREAGDKTPIETLVTKMRQDLELKTLKGVDDGEGGRPIGKSTHTHPPASETDVNAGIEP